MIAPSNEQPDFYSMTKAQLIDYADENGIEVNGGKKKADIIETIESAM